MNCPIDNTVLTMSERSGIEIDFCPQCRGVWLDRGELDKIIERTSPGNTSPPQSSTHNIDPEQSRQKREYYGDRDEYYHGKKRKKENFLSDLFDF